MESLTNATPTQNVPKTATAKEETKPQAPAYLTDFMNFMADLPTLYKDFASDGKLGSESARDESLEGISPYNEEERAKRGRGKINLKNPGVQQVVASIDSLGLDPISKDYLLTLGNRESGLNPGATQGSFKGLYQFNRDSLKSVGISENDYKTDLNKQHAAALKYKEINLKILRNYKKYIGTTFKGTPITENGMAAAAHLLGAGTVMDWFDGTSHSERARKGFKDGLGTSIMDYFELFA
jgi:hypothetical protein